MYKILLEKQTAHFRVYLIGGEMRHITEAFVGEMANAMLEKLRFSKMFFSSNAVNKGAVMTSTLDEAYTQQLALSNSIEKYLLIDHTKVGKEDFTSFCQLNELTAVVMDYEREVVGIVKICIYMLISECEFAFILWAIFMQIYVNGNLDKVLLQFQTNT